MADHIGVIERSNVHTNTIWIAPTCRLYGAAVGTAKSQSLGRQVHHQSCLNSLGGGSESLYFLPLHQQNPNTTLRRKNNVICKNMSKGFKSQLESTVLLIASLG